jgi:hypothetical protein
MPSPTDPKNYVCASCGYRHLERPQRNATGGASHEICPSCGFESGYTDDEQDITFEQWRQQWVAKGLPWSSKGQAKPAGWNPMVDLHALLKRKRPVVPTHIMAKRSKKLSEKKAKASEQA